MWDPGTDPGTGKGHWEKTGKSRIVCDSVNGIILLLYNVSFLVSISHSRHISCKYLGKLSEQ